MFLSKPFLPDRPVALCALSAGHPGIVGALERRGIPAMQTPPHPFLPEPVAAHADLQLHPLGGNALLALEGCTATRDLQALGFAVQVSAARPTPRYPGDVPLCCFALGDVLYCHPQHTAPELLRRYRAVQPVKQGYARCSTAIVDAAGIITADAGIAAAAAQNGLSALRIRPGYIALPGYSEGFIGGCCGLLSPGLLAFTGNLATHPDGDAIRGFCLERGVEPVCLTDGPLLDIGGILPLLQS